MTTAEHLPQQFVWERIRIPDESWHLVDPQNPSAGCGLSMIAREVEQVSVVRPDAVVCTRHPYPMLHLDAWPDRDVCGRTPLCLECSVVAWKRCQ